MIVVLGHFYDVPTGRTVAHLTVDPRLLKLKMIGLETCSISIPQLAGMAHRANGLIAGRRVKFLPSAWVCSLAPWAINHFPKVHPTLVQHVVLNREDVDFAIRQLRSISLLKFRSDGVVDRIAAPPAIGLKDIEIVTVFAHQHLGEKIAFPFRIQFELSTLIVCFIA